MAWSKFTWVENVTKAVAARFNNEELGIQEAKEEVKYSGTVAENWNIALGLEALANISLTYGAENEGNNIAIGREAMKEAGNSEPHGAMYNVVIGSQAAVAAHTYQFAENTVIGGSALRSLPFGEGNTVVGWLAAKDLAEGDSNTLVGSNVLTIAGSVLEGTLIGYKSGYEAVTGTKCVGVGANTLAKNEKNNIVAVGWNALAGNTKGEHNCCVGDSAGASNTTGSENTALGNLTLTSNGEGSKNTAVGYEALRENTTGEANTAVGLGASEENTTGVKNVAVGERALTLNTTGKENVAIGTLALSSNLSGEQNVAVGYLAGEKSTGSGNIFIGQAAGKGATGSNELFIANNETTPWIHGQESGLKLGFYGVTPVAKAAEITVPGAFKSGSKGFETEAEAKEIREKLTKVIEALKGIGICK